MIETNVKIAEVEKELKILTAKEKGIKDRVLMTIDLNDSILVKVIEEELAQINCSRLTLNTQLKELEASKNQMTAPVSTQSLKKSIKLLIGEMSKKPDAVHRGMLEKVFHKIVIKSGEEIELQMFGEIVGENKTTRSSSGGLNGGSNKT